MGKLKGKNLCLFFQMFYTEHIPRLFLDMNTLKAKVQKQVRIYLNNGAFRGACLAHALPWALLSWYTETFLDLSPCLSFPLPLLLCLSAALSALNSTHAQPLPAPSNTHLCCEIPTYKEYTMLDPTLFLFSISLNLLTSLVLLLPLQLSATVRTSASGWAVQG